MAFYQFTKEQTFKQSKEELWSFISDPRNLAKITPDEMGFKIKSKDLEDNIYPGMIINYKVTPLLGIGINWVTEITHVKPGEFFIDEQRMGPYKMWHHQHFLKTTSEGTIMTDIVSYVPPLGFLGSIANTIIIKNKLNQIFDYRTKVLNEMFDEVK